MRAPRQASCQWRCVLTDEALARMHVLATNEAIPGDASVEILANYIVSLLGEHTVYRHETPHNDRLFAASAASEQHTYTGARPGVPAVPQAEVRDGRVGTVRPTAAGVWGLAPMKLRSTPWPGLTVLVLPCYLRGLYEKYILNCNALKKGRSKLGPNFRMILIMNTACNCSADPLHRQMNFAHCGCTVSFRREKHRAIRGVGALQQ